MVGVSNAGKGEASPIAITTGDTDRIQQALLGHLRFNSFLGLCLVALVGGAVAYWLAGLALRPLSNVAQSTRLVTASSLHKRLTVPGPQDEIKNLVESFNNMLGRLEGSFDQQTQFVTNAAHELRTPLATLRTNLDVMYEDREATAKEYRDIAPVLDRCVTRLERLIEDLLLLARGEDRRHWQEVALQPIVADVLLELASLASRMEVTVHLEAEPNTLVYGDAPLLARVLSNLIENGIRYNKKGGRVSIKIARSDENAIITISDTGIGIAPLEQPRIFERFYRVDQSRSRNLGGSGLGLSIVSHIVGLHGGHVSVESNLGVGSTFVVQLPLMCTLKSA
jgi:heavy metal sensor kinase